MRLRSESVTYRLPKVLDAVTPENILEYLVWDRSAQALGRDVIDPFVAGAKARSRFGPLCIPAETTSEVVFEQGAVKVVVQSSPPSPRTDWHKVYDGLDSFVRELELQYEQGVRREGVWTHRERKEPFVELPQVTMRKVLLENVLTSCSKSPVQQVSVSGADEESEELVIHPRDRDYSVLSLVNAQAFATTRYFIEEGKRRTEKEVTASGIVPRLKELLKADVLEQIGGRPQYKTFVPYSSPSGVTFDVAIKPQNNPAYGEMMDDLFKGAPVKLRKNSRVGVLVLCALVQSAEVVSQRVREKGLFSEEMDERFLPQVSPRNIPSVRLQGVRDVIDEVYARRQGPYNELTIECAFDSLRSLLNR